MASSKKWLIYGATGETGKRIVEYALQRGHQPTLAGRSEQKLKRLAAIHHLHWEKVDLNQPMALRTLLTGYDLIVNVANSFDITRPPLIEAALKTKTHYLDIANDMDSIEQALQFDHAAKQANLCVMSGVGFGTAASGCLMKYLYNQLPSATHAEITLHLHTSILSPGALTSSFKEFSKLGTVFKQGKRFQLPTKERIKPARSRHAKGTLLAAPMGDLQAAYEATAIPNIHFYLALGMPYGLAKIINRFMGLSTKLNIDLMEHCIKFIAPIINTLKRLQSSPGSAEHSRIDIRLEQADGRSISGSLITGEGYDFTAQITVLAIEQVLGEKLVGAMIPAQAFDADFVLQVDGVARSLNNE